ncbi:uncharacterized protein LOC123465231 isoform X3 [Bubalus bubalis]|uniref:uncharacterized protein LOC123465231 isoform X3 n=1 Tax=Bubalus bubalis TaxID=89462 RepID=UPI001E1B765A|nr:uncharacterized protein LOC123465231 isoform X3 [Bubalus bubalis]
MLPKAHLTSHSTMSGSRTLGCTPRSSWISPGSDHYMAREIAPQRDKKDRACQNQVDHPSSTETRPGPRLPALRLVCVLSTLQWNKKGPSLQEPSRLSPPKRTDLPVSPSPASGVCSQHLSGTRKEQPCQSQVCMPSSGTPVLSAL